MKKDQDWIDVMRSELRKVELPPPSDGWERLQRRLEASPDAAAGVPERLSPAAGIRWRRLRIAAAAAVIVVGVLLGELLLRPDVLPEPSPLPLADRGRGASDTLRNGTAEPSLAVAAPQPSPESLPAPALSTSEPSEGPESFEGSESEPAPDGRAHGVQPSEDASSDSSAAPVGTEVADSPAVSDVPDVSEMSAVSAAAETADDAPAAPAIGSSGGRTGFDGVLVADAGPSDLRRAARRGRGRTVLGLFASEGPTGGGSATNGGLTMNSGPLFGDEVQAAPTQIDYDDCRFRHRQSFGFGVSVRRELRYGFSVESGLVYTLLRSDVTVPGLFAGEDLLQQVHLLGLPLRANWCFMDRAGFSLYIGGGLLVETPLLAKLGSQRIEERTFLWSLVGLAGVEYRFDRNFGLYFEPEVSCNLSQPLLHTARTESSACWTLRLGMRVSF